jgi:outer membrane protein
MPLLLLARHLLLRTIFISIALLCESSSADSLREIYELAIKNDAKLGAAEATYRATIETEKQARSRLLPQLSADGSYTASRRLQNTNELNTSSTGIVNSEQHRASTLRDGLWEVSLSQTLFDLPSWFSFKSGKALSEQAAAQFAYDQQDMIVRVAEAYFNVLRQVDNVSASQMEETANKEQWQQNQARFTSGVVGIADVDQAHAEYEISVAKRLTDQGNLEAAYAALTAITGVPHSRLSLLNKDFAVTEPQPVDQSAWVQFALTNNYALKAALAAMESANQNTTAKRSEYLPKITGSLSYQDDNVNGQQTINPDSPFTLPPGSETHTKMAAVKISLPLYSGGYTSSQARQAYEQYNTSLEKKIDTERTIIQNTQAKHIAASTDVHRVKAEVLAIAAGSSALDATRAGYKSGIKSIVDVLQSQHTLFATMRDHANARYDYVMDMVKLKQLAGTLSPQDIYELDKWLVEPAMLTSRTIR